MNLIPLKEKTLESPLDCKEIQPVHSKRDRSWVFFGRNDAETETPTLWPPHVKGWLIGKDSDAGRDWGQEEKGMTEDEMAGWHHWLDGHESEWTPGVGDGQGGLACCNSWGCKELDTTEWLNWTDKKNLKKKVLDFYFIMDSVAAMNKNYTNYLCIVVDFIHFLVIKLGWTICVSWRILTLLMQSPNKTKHF